MRRRCSSSALKERARNEAPNFKFQTPEKSQTPNSKLKDSGLMRRAETDTEIRDPWVEKFLAHLATDRGASIYTQRNYRQAVHEFQSWHREERKQAPVWDKLQRDDFRGYLRFLGRHELGRAAIQLRFSALRTFYKFLIRHGVVAASPIKNLALPKIAKRLPKFLTPQQMNDLLRAPLKLLPSAKQTGPARAAAAIVCRRDVAVLETIYSCGLRISELCGLRAGDGDWNERAGRREGSHRFFSRARSNFARCQREICNCVSRSTWPWRGWIRN